MAQNSAFAGSKISFTHFSTMMNIDFLTRSWLQAAFFSGRAAICPPNQEGADWIIPVQLSNGSFTAIFGQTKNYAKAPRWSGSKVASFDILPTAVLDEKHALHDLSPVFTIYHQVGRLDGEVAMCFQHLSLTGLCMSSTLPPSTLERLFRISDTRFDSSIPSWPTSVGCLSSLQDYFPDMDFK